MKKLALLLALILLATTTLLPVLAEEPADFGDSQGESSGESSGDSDGDSAGEATGDSAGEPAEEAAEEPAIVEIKVFPFETVDADETTGQPQLGYDPETTTILDVDGLKFKDMNNNGELDVYEDWREDIDTRIADLMSQMTLKEKSMLLYHICTCSDNSGVVFDMDNLYKEDAPYDGTHYSMWYHIKVYGITDYLDNSNGTPDEQVWAHNVIQSIAESTRLGVPVTFSSDREFNAWGGYIDTPHDAFATANDKELAVKLWESYSAQTRAVGYHVLFHPYGVEIGSWNGEDPAYIADMTYAEVEAIQNGGSIACVKHFIARGGDQSFESGHSDAYNIDNYMLGWKAAIEAGTQYIMTNSYNKGLAGDVTVDYDFTTLPYLRNELGYDGVILTDWGSLGNDYGSQVNGEGVDFGKFSLAERYAWVINNGVDQMGAPGAGATVEETLAATGPGILYVEGIKEAVEQGLITEERLDDSCRRILYVKFWLGLFENPYSDGDAALALSANEDFIANKWAITDNESLVAARKADEVELERQLMAKSTVLVKNDDNLLPLEKGIKVYITASNGTALEAYKKYIAEYAEVVEDIEDADVVIGDFSRIDDIAEMTVDDAIDYEKKLVITCNNIDPDTYVMQNADAVLFLNFSRTADHGTGVAGIITTMEGDVYAQLLFGEREPEGMIVKEIARDSAMDEAQWKDLAGDQGAPMYVRLMLEAMMMTSETYSTPNNWGDPLLQYKYGMRYGQEPEFSYTTLVLPKVTKEIETESSGSTSISYQTSDGAKAGEPFSIFFLIWNKGADGFTKVQALVDGEVNAEKLMAVNSGDWRVVEMQITIDQPGEHTITVGDITKSIEIAE
ncbi:MAG: glycoside hydrolase family 3 protein [Clostridia bacterium]|nr:glycoside hydrolase family 3 protein [Clostridia bacterium]